ncbi:MAG: hypothetical protein VYD19_06705, partial [Myxococcota bacterium]|nr:hypothetical protein [Myxococcota bacterium]
MNAICADFRLMSCLDPHVYKKMIHQAIYRGLRSRVLLLPLCVSLICSLPLSAVNAKAPLPNQSATQLEPKLLMALNHPEGRSAALQQLLKLKADTLEQLNDRVFDLLEQLCLQHNLSLTLRYRA